MTDLFSRSGMVGPWEGVSEPPTCGFPKEFGELSRPSRVGHGTETGQQSNLVRDRTERNMAIYLHFRLVGDRQSGLPSRSRPRSFSSENSSAKRGLRPERTRSFTRKDTSHYL